MWFASVVRLVLFYLLEADLPLQSTTRFIYSHPEPFWDPKSACICCLTATNVFSLTEEGAEVILCRRKTDTGHFVSERISGKMSHWAQRAVMRCQESDWCSFVHNHDEDDNDQNGDMTLPLSQMLSCIISPQLHGSMWSQRDEADGNITVYWSVLYLTNLIMSVVLFIYCTLTLSSVCSACVHICACVPRSDPGGSPLQRSQTCSQAKGLGDSEKPAEERTQPIRHRKGQRPREDGDWRRRWAHRLTFKRHTRYKSFSLNPLSN